MGVSFSTAVKAKLVTRPVVLGILFFASVILALKFAFLTSPLIFCLYH